MKIERSKWTIAYQSLQDKIIEKISNFTWPSAQLIVADIALYIFKNLPNWGQKIR